MRPAGWNRSFAGREKMWVMAPPRIDPMMPSTIVQKSVMCACITDFARIPAISPTRIYQMKWNIVQEHSSWDWRLNAFHERKDADEVRQHIPAFRSPQSTRDLT